MAECCFRCDAGRLHVLRPWFAGGGAPDDDRGRLGLDELHHAADVAAFGYVFFVRAISASLSALHQNSAVDRTQLSASSIDERRRPAYSELGSDCYPGGLVSGELLSGAKDFQMA